MFELASNMMGSSDDELTPVKDIDGGQFVDLASYVGTRNNMNHNEPSQDGVGSHLTKSLRIVKWMEDIFVVSSIMVVE